MTRHEPASFAQMGASYAWSGVRHETKSIIALRSCIGTLHAIHCRMTHSTLGVVLCAFVVAGCNSNLYATPRTTPPGSKQHIVALNMDFDPKSKEDLGVDLIPPAMIYIARIGLTDRLDLGISASGSLKVDLKYNPIRTEYFDLAIDPSVFGTIGVGGLFIAPFAVASLPVILGFNAGESMTLVIQGGPAVSNLPGMMVYPFAGGGLQLRFGDLVTVQPEFTLQFMGEGRVWACYGLGFGFGPHASYKPPPKKSRPRIPSE